VSPRISIVGTGYVGMASAIGFAEFGFNVVGYDVQHDRIADLARGIAPYHEAGIAESLQRHLTAGRLSFVDDLKEAVEGSDVIVIAVGTPSMRDGSSDLSYLRAAVDALAACDVAGSTIVLRSTVPVGTTEVIAERFRGVADVVFAPEFLREGTAVPDFLDPDRIVVGAPSIVEAQAYSDLFAHLDKPLIVTSYRNAELIKQFSNAFLAMKISFANEVANFCDAVDADALDVLNGVGHDRRIGGAFFGPGIGFGGPCFEKDLSSLYFQASAVDTPFELIGATLRINQRQPMRVVDLLESELGSLSGTHLGVWGLAFKGGTDDVRDSLALRVVDELIARGAHISAYDPAVSGTSPRIGCALARTALDAAANSDALLVLTDWPQFRDVDPHAIGKRIRRGLVVDGRNVLDGSAIAAAGMRYLGIGRRSLPSTIETWDDAVAV
jgi:UDPglucose 6-dehydrogenase